MTLQLYILRHLTSSVAFALSGIALIVLPTALIQAIHRLGAVSLGSLSTYLPLVLVELVPYLLPIAFLLGIVATYGRLAAERELVAIKMAGIHPAKLAIPTIVVGLGLSFVTHHLLATVAPTSKYQARNYLREQAVEAFRNFRQSGSTTLPFGGSTLNADAKHDNVFEGVLLDLDLGDDNVFTITADTAVLDIRYDESIGEDVLVIDCKGAEFLGENFQLDNASPYWVVPMSKIFKVNYREMEAKYTPSAELRTQLDGVGLTPEDRLVYTFEIHRRSALSMTYLVFLLLGIPTGIVLRSGTQLSAFTGAVGYAFAYYVLIVQMQSLAASETLSPEVAAWATNGLFLVAGLVFFYRALWR